MRSPLALLCLCFGCAVEVPYSPPAIPSDYCLYGLRLRREELAALRASEPFCLTDEDCVMARAHVEGRCGSVELCGEVMHRETAAAWDSEALGDEMCLNAPRSLTCAIQPACVGVRPRCEQQRCVAGDDLDDLFAPKQK